jgi:hypothetical protein
MVENEAEEKLLEKEERLEKVESKEVVCVMVMV